MNTETNEDTQPINPPDDAVVYRQSNWAWIWHAVPWLLLFIISMAFDFFTFGIFPTVFAIIIIVPRYFSFKRTGYILGENNLIIQEGLMLGQRRVDLPILEIREIEVQTGTFGRYLGYTNVKLESMDKTINFIQYLPVDSPLIGLLQNKVKR